MSGAKGKASDTAGSLFDRVKVPVLVILVFPLFGAFLSSTACLSLAVAGFNLSWLLFKGLWTEGRAAAEKRLGDAYDEFAVASWLVLYLVATPFGLVAIILSLVLLGFSSVSAPIPQHIQMETTNTLTRATISHLAFDSQSVYVQAFHRVLVTAFAVYCLWAYLWDDSVNRGGMANPKLRDAAYFKHLARYFDLKMTVDHDEADDGGAAGGSGSEGEAKDHHIFCYHPHGIVFWGVIAGFASHAVSSTVTFKGQRLSDLDIRMGTISFNNLVPLFREINKNLGCFNVSRKVCERALRDNKNSESLSSLFLFLIVSASFSSLRAILSPFQCEKSAFSDKKRLPLLCSTQS